MQGGILVGKRRRPRGQHEGHRKRPTLAFQIFSNDYKKELMASDPSMELKEAAVLASEKWKSMSRNDKRKWSATLNHSREAAINKGIEVDNDSEDEDDEEEAGESESEEPSSKKRKT